MHDFSSDFYGYEMRAVVLGYIRPELDYTSRGHFLSANVYTLADNSAEALIDDIEVDKKVALNSLARPGYQKFVADPHFVSN
jgi:riboflavin kinase